MDLTSQQTFIDNYIKTKTASLNEELSKKSTEYEQLKRDFEELAEKMKPEIELLDSDTSSPLPGYKIVERLVSEYEGPYMSTKNKKYQVDERIDEFNSKKLELENMENDLDILKPENNLKIPKLIQLLIDRNSYKEAKEFIESNSSLQYTLNKYYQDPKISIFNVLKQIDDSTGVTFVSFLDFCRTIESNPRIDQKLKPLINTGIINTIYFLIISELINKNNAGWGGKRRKSLRLPKRKGGRKSRKH